MDIVLKYFPDLTTAQQKRFKQLQPLYREWNSRINVISRKDIDQLYERHVLHSLSIGQFVRFREGSKVLDVGTGGGFPGIPLAILFPESHFHLVDSVGKKVRVVQEIKSALNLENLTTEQIRAEQHHKEYDFAVSRAVTNLPDFVQWVQNNISKEQKNALPNGILYLKGGNLENELKPFRKKVFVQNLSAYFDEPFFETKKLVHLPL